MEAKEVRKLIEAYASVYSQQEEVIAEAECECEDEKEDEKKDEESVEMNGKKKSKKKELTNEDLQQTVDTALKAGQKFMKTNPVGKALGAVIAPVGAGRGTVTAAEQQKKVQQNVTKEEVETDLFDYLLEYLVAEGYADTNKAALAIMANMSEEWKQSIVEQMTVNVADVKGGTQAAKNAQAGMKDKSGNPMYKPGVGVGPDFKLVKGV